MTEIFHRKFYRTNLKLIKLNMMNFSLHRFIRVSLISASFLLVNIARADFELGLKYYEQANYEKAYQEFTQAAKYGDFSAQFNLGVMYYKGQFVKQDVLTGYAWLSLAAQDAEYKERGLHLQIYKGFSEEQKKQADKAAQEMFDQFSSAAITRSLTPAYTEVRALSSKIRPIKSVDPVYPRSMLNRDAMGWVDVLYTVEKDGTTRDHTVISATHKEFAESVVLALRQWQYEPAMAGGKAVPVFGMRLHYVFHLDEFKFEQDIVNATLREYREKAYTGNANAQYQYAYYLTMLPSFIEGLSNEDASEKPHKWFLSAAQNGHQQASFFLGKSLLNGDMCTPDANKSLVWLQKAAANDFVDAQYILARELLSGSHFKKDEEQAMYWLHRATAGNLKGGTAAKLQLAWILATHPDKQKRNGTLAQQLIQTVDVKYNDKQTYYRTAAAVAAENADFDAAVKWQEQALADAQKLKLPEETLRTKLQAYIAKQALREEI